MEVKIVYLMACILVTIFGQTVTKPTAERESEMTINGNAANVYDETGNLRELKRIKRRGGLGAASSVSGIMVDLSTVASNIHNMYLSSHLTDASIRALDAQTRATQLLADLNELNFNEKKGLINIHIHRLQLQVRRLKRNVKELEQINRSAYGEQRALNDRQIEEKNEEIELTEKEIEIYSNLIKK